MILTFKENLLECSPNCEDNPLMVVGFCGFSHCVRWSCLAKECLRSNPDPVTGLTSDQDQLCLCMSVCVYVRDMTRFPKDNSLPLWRLVCFSV